mgnify:CR=1 FL=1
MAQKILFIDRDGTLIKETLDEQIDAYEKVTFYPKSLTYLSKIASELDFELILPAMAIGFLSVGVLNLNNMRDEASDKKSGKNTIVVKIGSERAKKYHYFLIG